MKAIVSVALVAAGCATINQEPGGGEPQGACNAAAVQDLAGKPLAASQADAKQRAGAAVVRSYESGSALTMDYRADRLNIETDAGGTIVKLSCG